LDGVLTDSTGRFVIDAATTYPLTLVVKRLGFEPHQRVLTASDTGSITVTLTRGSVSLAAVSVTAGSYTADEERGATLTPLQIVTTPGAAADITRAMQTLPGVQSVDEGNALFVRGGDYTETRIFLNEAPLLNPQQVLSASGTFIGTVDPFQLDGIFFSSGGFGARYGNALSAVAGLETKGRATAFSGTATWGLANASADLALPLSSSASIRVAANRLDLTPLFRLNGTTRRFDPPPRGHDLSASAAWVYRAGAEVKLFSIDQATALGVALTEPAFDGLFTNDERTRLTVLSWRDVIGKTSSRFSLSRTTQDSRQSYGLFRLTNSTARDLAFGRLEWAPVATATLRLGGDIERTRSSLTGVYPRGPDSSPGAPERIFAFGRSDVRVGPYAELDWRPTAHARLISGLRADHSDLTHGWTADPRVSWAYQPATLITLTAAWGIYHQIAEPLFYDSTVGVPDLPSMRATQSVLGMQLGEGNLIVRVEAYLKQYEHLAQLSREHAAVGGGRGRARGMDFFFKGAAPYGLQTRTTVSLLAARRTDPSSGLDARAPFDITRSTTIIVEKSVRGGLRFAGAYRSATGRPLTPVTGASYDQGRDEYTPMYGAPMSERFPGFRRFDISASWFRPLAPGWQGVVYVSMNNVFDRVNVQSYTYTRDYAERIPIQSIFNRSVYFGATLLRQ
ncbi:MAG: hypothetical protein ABI877_07240, partial [Gemmatimonadaceae bacterium]